MLSLLCNAGLLLWLTWALISRRHALKRAKHLECALEAAEYRGQ